MVRREVLYNIFLQVGRTLKPIRRIKIYLYEAYIKVLIGQYMAEMVSIQNGPKLSF
jgi:hypothetical protein